MFAKNISRIISLAVLVSLLLAGCGGGAPTAASDPATASLSEVQGQVDILNPGEAGASPAADGMILQVNGQVVTGEDGRVRLDLSTGTIVRLASNTNFTLISNDPEPEGLWTRIKVEVGKIWVSLNGGAMDVETPSGLASVRGSNLMIWIDPATLNVYVNCMEGDCGAANDSGSLDLATGYGALLYHVETGGSPPPPASYAIPWEYFQDWLENNPEAGNVLPGLVQTLTAIPPFTATPTSTPIPPSPTATATPSCLSLLTPPNGANLPAEGKVDFTWTEYPGAYKYIVTFVQPNGHTASVLAWTPSLSQYIEAFAEAGAYQWKVTVKDANIRDICTAGPFTFTKPQSVRPTPAPTKVPPTPKPGNTDTTFANIIAPGNPSYNCVNYFQVDAYDPEGLTYVKVQYKVFDGNGSLMYETYQHLSQTETNIWSGNLSIASLVPGGKVVWWFWAIDNQSNSTYSGASTFDYAGSISCP